jgi:hypothetical protein
VAAVSQRKPDFVAFSLHLMAAYIMVAFVAAATWPSSGTGLCRQIGLGQDPTGTAAVIELNRCPMVGRPFERPRTLVMISSERWAAPRIELGSKLINFCALTIRS